ncbi:MAG: YncE family protein [Myxococcaceae bacterium]
MRRVALAVFLLSFAAQAADGGAATSSSAVALPNGAPGIGFDDLRMAHGLGKVLVPAGRSGRLDLVDPKALEVVAISGFSEKKSFEGGHDDGVTSADEGRGLLFATDRTTKKLSIIDPRAGKIVGELALSGGPDYVRYVSTTDEVWVTEPDVEAIEIFKLSAGDKPSVQRVANVHIKGGPESLVIDAASGRAFTHLWSGKSVAIDLKKRSVGPAWANGCKGSRGIAFDAAAGWLITGCAEGGAGVIDVRTGELVSSLSAGSGVDIIDYDPKRRRIYLGAGGSATLEILQLSSDGKLSHVASIPTQKGSHCVAANGDGLLFVCDPSHGQLLVIHDPQS